MAKGYHIKISAVVLSYKGGDRLIPTLESCKLQTYPNKDLVIADDASPDKGYSVSIIEKWLEENRHHFTNVCFIKNQQNQGIVKNLRNAALEAKGDIIFSLGQGDTCYGPDTFQLIAEEIQDQHNKGTGDPLIWLGYYKTFVINPFWNNVDHILTPYCLASTPYQFNLINSKPEKALKIILFENFIGGASLIYLKKYFKEEFFPLPDDISDIEDYPSLLYMLINRKKIGNLDFYIRWYEDRAGITSQSNTESLKKIKDSHAAISRWLKSLAKTDDRLGNYLKDITPDMKDPRTSFTKSWHALLYKKFVLPTKNLAITKLSGKPFEVNNLFNDIVNKKLITDNAKILFDTGIQKSEHVKFNIDTVNFYDLSLAITGWAIIENEESTINQTYIMVENSTGHKSFYETDKRIRIDVGEHLKNEIYNASGFYCVLSKDAFSRGKNKISVILGPRYVAAAYDNIFEITI